MRACSSGSRSSALPSTCNPAAVTEANIVGIPPSSTVMWSLPSANMTWEVFVGPRVGKIGNRSFCPGSVGSTANPEKSPLEENRVPRCR